MKKLDIGRGLYFGFGVGRNENWNLHLDWGKGCIWKMGFK